MRRVSFVRVVTDATGVWAEAVGVGHRLPVTRTITVAKAVELSQAGVPLVQRTEVLSA